MKEEEAMKVRENQLALQNSSRMMNVEENEGIVQRSEVEAGIEYCKEKKRELDAQIENIVDQIKSTES